MHRLLLALTTTLLVAGCEKSPKAEVTPPVDGVPTHVPALAPQVDAMQRAKALEAEMLDAAKTRAEAAEAATQ